MDTGMYLLVIPLLFAGLAAVRQLVLTIRHEGLPRRRGRLDQAYAERLLTQAPGHPLQGDHPLDGARTAAPSSVRP